MTIRNFKDEFAFLSNFYFCHISWHNRIWSTVEHAYQAAKLDPNRSDLFEQQESVRQCATPVLAKKLGQRIILRSDWESKKIEVMRELLIIKFSDPELRRKLTATNNAELIEENWWNDTFWGVCRGVGENWLGRLLMEVRSNG